MLDLLRETLIANLAAHTVCILSGSAPDGVWTQPVSYSSHELTLHCQLPRWADAAFYLEQPARVVVIIPAANDAEQWLQCLGTARIVAGDHRYLTVEVVAQRLDLFDGRRGWGVRETLDV